MKEKHNFIFDMDGTLYAFNKGKGGGFTSSQFYSDVKSNVYRLLTTRLGIGNSEAETEYERIKEKYSGEVSLGVEGEHGIDRYDFFENTWNLNPEEYIEKDEELSKALSEFKGRVALLTAAPRIWALNVLSHLNLENVFENRVYTGEPNERKPNPIVFQRIADDFEMQSSKIFSIGDQEASDIIPAKSIGMKTILIGSSPTSKADYQVRNARHAIRLLKDMHFI